MAHRVPLALWAAAVTLAFCGWWALAKTQVESDIAAFIPWSSSPQQRLLFEELREGPAARLILIAVEGGSEAERAHASRALAQKLRSSGLFVRVANGEDEIDQDERRRFFAYRYLLSPDSGRFDAAGLRTAFERRLQELHSPVSTFSKHLLAEDPTGSFLAYARGLRGERRLQTRHGLWFSDDGSSALLLAESRARGLDLNAQEEVLSFLRHAFSAVSPGDDLRLLLSGPSVFAVDSRSIIIQQSNWLAFAALLAVNLILILGYRSPSLLLIGALPIAAALLVGAAAVSFVYGSIQGISLAFGITLLGITVDYPIHLFSHSRAGMPPESDLMRIWPTMRLSAITTGIGFLTMATTRISGLTQLGLLAVSGILAAALVTRWVLPWVLARSGFSGLAAMDPRPWSWLLTPSRPAAAIGLLAAGGALMYLVLLAPPVWEDDLSALSPVPAELIARDRVLRAQLKAPDVNHLILISAAEAQTVMQRAESLEPRLQDLVAAGLIDGYEVPTRLLPSRKTQLERRAALPDRRTLRGDLEQALEGLPFKPGVFRPFEEAVAQARTQPPLEPADLEGTEIGLRLSSQLFRGQDGWLLLVPLSGVRDREGLAAWLREEAPQGAFYLDIKGETGAVLANLRDGALERFGLGAVLIIGILAIGLRSIGAALRVVLPVSLALTLDLAILSWMGERLSLFHLVSLLLVLGISLDYSLFFGREADSRDEHMRTVHALTVCALSTVCLFGLLALSSIPVLNAMGKTIGIGVLCGYFMALALSPRVERAT